MIVASSFGKESVSVLAEAVRQAKAGDPLAPVTVATQSSYARLHLRRAGEMLSAGVLNVSFMPLSRVAELLALPLLAAEGLKPLRPVLAAEIVRQALEETQTMFSPVREHPATAESLVREFRDLREVSPEGLVELSRHSLRAAHVVEVYQTCRARVEDLRRYDQCDCMEAAARAVAQGSAAIHDLGHIILHLPGGVRPSEAGLLRALNAKGLFTAVTGFTGESEADAGARSVWSLFSPGEPEITAAAPEADLLVTVGDAEEEVREALRMVIERAEGGVPLYRMAILYRNPEPYARIGQEQLRAAGVPVNGPGVRRLSGTLAGRALLGMLRVRQGGFAREDLMDWLGSAPIVGADGQSVRVSAWERVARRAGVVKGVDGWKAGLGRFRSALDMDLRDEDDDSGETSAPAQTEAREAAKKTAGELLGFVLALALALDYKPEDSWGSYARKTEELLRGYTGFRNGRGRWVGQEADHFEAVADALKQLAMLDEVRSPVRFADFSAAVSQALSATAGPCGHYGDGVFLGSFADARGMSFHDVFILGMAEGIVPATPGHDSLISAEEREALNGELPSPRQTADERALYLMALAAGERRTLLFPRADRRGNRENLPSRWFMAAASRLEGRPMAPEDLNGSTRDWLRCVPSFESALLSRTPGSLQEYRLHSLMRWLRSGKGLAEHPLFGCQPLKRQTERERARPAWRLTAWSGHVKEGSCACDGPFSASRLEAYGVCPFRYFLKYVLQVEEIREPDDMPGVDPLIRGQLYHAVLRRFMAEHIGRPPGEPWTEQQRQHLLTLAQDAMNALEEQGLAGVTALWTFEQSQVLDDLTAFLGDDSAFTAECGCAPRALEQPFGDDGSVSLACGGRRVSFHGRIDRVDVSPDGRSARVIDYKTGAVRKKKLDGVEGGRKLQLPMYALAVESALGIQDNVQGVYWHLRGPDNRDRVPVTWDADMKQAFCRAVEVIVEGITRGLFPANPGKAGWNGGENCAWCAYQRICPADRVAVWERICREDALRDYAELQGLTGGEEAGDE